MQWIPISSGRLPELKTWVACCRLNELNWPEWVAKARVTESGTWSLQATVGLSLYNSKPTHWIELPR